MRKDARVVYCGPEPEAVSERWAEAERPFALVEAVGPDETEAALSVDRTDALVLHDEGELDVLGVVDTVEDDRLVAVIAGLDGVAADRALEAGADHVLPADGDVVDLLAGVGDAVERYCERRRERSMLDSLMQQIPLSVYFKDPDSRHVRVSDRMITMIGPDYIESPEGKRHPAPEDVEGKTDFDLYPGPLAEEAVTDDEAVLETEGAIENRIEHFFGTPTEGTWVTTSKAPWYDEHGDVAGVVGITRDISERKQYETKLERQNERLERFASVISHDLRNPLEVAHARVQLARETGDDEHFEAASRALERIDELVDDVLEMTRHGESVEDTEAVDLATMAREAWEVVETSDSELVVETERSYFADPGRLSRLLENLFRNAVTHGAPAEDGVTVTVGDRGAEADSPGFYVADDGLGVAEEVREKVFEPGYTTAEEGTGLGLGIVKSIADAHGWSVDLTEGESGGARFVVTDVRPADADHA